MGMRASRPIGIALILPSLTHRRTVNGCKPRRLATSPERRSRVFSVLITRIVYRKYVDLSTEVHPDVEAGRAGVPRRIPGGAGIWPLERQAALALSHVCAQ